ncbi:hypothetical protein GLGCALEP_01357 [Pseudomonas sp. MM221]|nr:hypothetical protein GLGCALEP_01357 [Pseudomonas sp. MM221]
MERWQPSTALIQTSTPSPINYGTPASSLSRQEYYHECNDLRGYAARIEYSDEDQLLIGHVAGIRDVIGFHGESISELRQAFEEAVDDYLEACKRLGREPQKTYSGKLSLRLEPTLHASVAAKAELAEKSINQWVSDILSKAAYS